LEEGGRSLAFIPDNEPALSCDLATADPSEVSGLDIAQGVDLLMHDAQYTAAEYGTRRGWGHTSVPDFVRFAELADAGHTLMFHHEPAHADEELEVMLDDARELSNGTADRIALAREGLEIDLSR